MIMTELQVRAPLWLRQPAIYPSCAPMASLLRVSIVLAVALVTAGCASEPADRAADASARAAEEFRRAVHACQHVRRPDAGDQWHAPATSPEVAACLARVGWQPDGTPTATAQFKRDLHACQHAWPHRRRHRAHRSPWEVSRCLKSKGWKPDGTRVGEEVN